MIPKLLIAFFSFLLINVTEGYSQNFILLQRGDNEKTQLRYEIGESITYKTENYDAFVTDVIKDIRQDIIVLQENVIRPENITVIDIRNKDMRNRTLQNLSYLSFGAGVIFLVAEGVNSIYHDGEFSISKGTWISSLVLTSTGFILSNLRYRYFKNKGKNKIQLVMLYAD